MRSTVLLFARRHQRMQHQQDPAADDGGIGHVEVGPVVVDDVDLEEVDDRAGADAIVRVADGARRE